MHGTSVNTYINRPYLVCKDGVYNPENSTYYYFSSIIRPVKRAPTPLDEKTYKEIAPILTKIYGPNSFGTACIRKDDGSREYHVCLHHPSKYFLRYKKVPNLLKKP